MTIRFPVFSSNNDTRKQQKIKNRDLQTMQGHVSKQEAYQYPADFGRKLLAAQLASLDEDIKLYNKNQRLNIEIENLKLRIAKETDENKKQVLISFLNEKIENLNELKKSFE